MQILDSLVDGAQELPVKVRERLYRAYIEYLRYGREPEGLEGVALGVWISVRPVLDNSRAKAEAGSRGGSRTQAERQANAKQTGKQTASRAPSKREADGQADSQANSEAEGQTNGQANAKRRGIGRGIGEETPTECVGVSGGAPADVAPAVLLVEAPAGPPGGAGPAYERPEPSEVAEFVAASGGHPIDAERFCRWHDDHGWPPRGWRGTALNWAAGDAARAASERAGREAIRDELAYLDEGAERV